MCFALLALHQHAEYPFILAANRDEFFPRPALPLHAWQDEPGVLGGRDLESMGTWLALNTRDNRLALVTNVRNGQPQSAERSRGLLVRDVVSSGNPVRDDLQTLLAEQGRYAGFNLIAGNLPDQLYYVSNRADVGIVPLAAGFYGLSNARLDTPWPKLVRGKAAFQQLVQTHETLAVEDLLAVLADKTPAAEADLPETGVGLEIERRLSPVFIQPGWRDYGTRCSTVLLLDRQGQISFHERTYAPDQSSQDVHLTILDGQLIIDSKPSVSPCSGQTAIQRGHHDDTQQAQLHRR